MITLKELNKNDYPIIAGIEENLKSLHTAMNIIRQSWGKPMFVTSGLRSLEKHKEIYRKKGISEEKIPMCSKHLIGAACDIADPKGELMEWCKANEELVKNAGIKAIELDTQGWGHFQIHPVKSGRFWFKA